MPDLWFWIGLVLRAFFLWGLYAFARRRGVKQGLQRAHEIGLDYVYGRGVRSETTCEVLARIKKEYTPNG